MTKESDISFNVVDPFISEGQVKKLTNDIYSILNEKINKNYLQDVLSRVLTKIKENTSDIYEFEKYHVRLKYTKDEYTNYFYRQVHQTLTKMHQEIFDQNKEAILNMITQDMTDLGYPDDPIKGKKNKLS